MVVLLIASYNSSSKTKIPNDTSIPNNLWRTFFLMTRLWREHRGVGIPAPRGPPTLQRLCGAEERRRHLLHELCPAAALHDPANQVHVTTRFLGQTFLFSLDYIFSFSLLSRRFILTLVSYGIYIVNDLFLGILKVRVAVFVPSEFTTPFFLHFFVQLIIY